MVSVVSRAENVYRMRFGNCPDPDSRAADGSRCGKRAASVRPDKGPKGDCFENCARHITLYEGEKDMRLVHGFVTGTGGGIGGGIEGVRYPHAWLEYSVPLEELVGKDLPPEYDNWIQRMAMDLTTDERLKEPLIMPADLYRVFGKAEPLVEYTADEARKLAAKTGHWGPWEPELLRWYGEDE
jgi:hypothetical protein